MHIAYLFSFFVVLVFVPCFPRCLNLYEHFFRCRRPLHLFKFESCPPIIMATSKKMGVPPIGSVSFWNTCNLMKYSHVTQIKKSWRKSPTSASVFQKSAKSRQKLGDKLDKLNSSHLKKWGESLSHTIHGTGIFTYMKTIKINHFM